MYLLLEEILYVADILSYHLHRGHPGDTCDLK